MSQRLTSLLFFLYIITLVTLQFTAMFDGCERVANDVGKNTDRIITESDDDITITDRYYTNSYEQLCMDFHEEKHDNEENELAIKEGPTSFKTRWKHVLNDEFALKIIEMVLLTVSSILYSLVEYTHNHTNFVKVYPNVVLMTFIIITLIRLLSIGFKWKISERLVILLNCIAAVMIGGSGGVTLHVWYYDPYVGKLSINRQSSNILLSEAVLCLFTPFVYLLDIAKNINSLQSLSF